MDLPEWYWKNGLHDAVITKNHYSEKNTTANLNGANYVIENGTYVPKMNGNIRFFGSGGKANYAFVGLTKDGNYITTFGIRSVSKLASNVDWLIP